VCYIFLLAEQWTIIYIRNVYYRMSYTLRTDCSLEEASSQEICYAQQKLLYDTTCATTSLTTQCDTATDSGNCYVCQNIQLQNAITDGQGLANALPQGKQHQDAYFTYWNEVSKTVYLSIGIAGILTCTYYIR